MACHLSLRRCLLFVACLMAVVPAAAQAQDVVPETVQLNQPIPVSIRMTNNSVVQTLLVGVNKEGITTVTAVGKTAEYSFKKIKSIRNQDGSIFFQPGKDNLTDLLKLLAKLQPPNAGGPGGIGQGKGTGTGAGPNGMSSPSVTFTSPSVTPSAGHGQGTGTTGGNVPFTSPSVTPSAGHGQGAGTTGGNVPFTSPSVTAPATGHAQPQTMPYPANTTPSPHAGPHAGPMPMPIPGQPNPGFTSPPPIPRPMGPHLPPGQPNIAPPNMGHGMGMGPQFQTMWEYTCTKCRQKITTTVEMQPGQKCPKCGTTWHFINGKGAPPTAPTFSNVTISPGLISGIIAGLVVVAGIVLFALKSAS